MNPLTEIAEIDQVALRLRQHLGVAPRVAIVLGSGLGSVAARLADPIVVSYPSLGLPPCGVIGHAGEIRAGQLEGVPVVILSGRWHMYEGYPAEVVVRGVRALARWGVSGLVLTSAVGGMAALRPGDLTVVRDHINLSGTNVLRGPNLRPPDLSDDDPRWVRFPDLSDLYSARLRALVRTIRPDLREVVYGAMSGPSYETPAEIRMLSTVGADVVGMSMVHEAIAARHAGVEVLGLSVVSNLAAGISAHALSHAEVTEATTPVAGAVGDLLSALVQQW